MKKNLKNTRELFEYFMYGHSFELEDVTTKNGTQKRLKDEELEQEIKDKTKEYIKVKDLLVELKLGVPYNRVSRPWVQIYTIENKSGTKGRYVGISFEKETDEIELWIGFGRSGKRQAEILEAAKEYKIKYSLIEPNLKYGFEYLNNCHDAKFIEKRINIKEFNEDEFKKDLEYITDLYKSYEVRFENSSISMLDDENAPVLQNKKISYMELNERMLALIEEVGNLAKAIRELNQ